MVLNIAAIPIVYFFLPETNGWKLETLDSIFADAHKQQKNPVFVERHWRKQGWQHKRDQVSGSVSDNDETKTLEAGDNSSARHLEEKQDA